MTMTNARQYCRSNHVDLASLRDAQDLQQLHDMRSNSTRWIGLNDDPATSMQTIDVYTNSWKWSFEYASGYLNFKSGEPDFKNDEEVCVWMDSDGSWRNQECSSLRHFLCFSGNGRFRINVILYKFLSDLSERVSLCKMVKETLSDKRVVRE